MKATCHVPDFKNNLLVKTTNSLFRNLVRVLFTLTFLGSFFNCCLNAQGLTSGTNMIVPNEIALFVNGKLEVNDSFKLGGNVHISGDFIDNYGINSTEGKMRFFSNDTYHGISGSAITVLNDLVIDQDALVQICPQKKITINGLLANNNSHEGLVLLSDNSGTASLIHYTSDIPAVVQHLPPVDNEYHFISAPVSYQQISPEFFSSDDLFFAWHEPIGIYIMYGEYFSYPTFADANQDKDYFLSAAGYLALYHLSGSQRVPRSFTGLMHQGKIDYVLSRKAHDEDERPGLNLAGNPYPSAIDWLAPNGWYGKQYLEGNKMSVAWVWNNEIQNFGVIHPASKFQYHNGINNIIPSRQGFFVKAASGNDGKILSMDDRVRVHSSTESEKTKESGVPSPDVLRIKVECDQNGYRDEVILEYGHKSLMTAKKLFSPNPESPQIFVCKDGEKYSMMLLPEALSEREHTVRIETPDFGQFSLAISGSDLEPLVEIVNSQTNKRERLLAEESIVFDGRESHFLEITVRLRL